MFPTEPIRLSREQIREVDRRAMDDYGIPGVVLMENAGRNAAEIIHRIAKARGIADAAIAIVCGRGNNGGDGFVIARHLHNLGRRVDLFLTAPRSSLLGDAAVNAAIVSKMGLPIVMIDNVNSLGVNLFRLHTAAIIVDAVLGTGFKGELKPPVDAVINAMNAAPHAMRIAVDVPSGLDCETGQPARATLRADATITFVAEKSGFSSGKAREFTGKVYIVGIGAPVELVHAVLGAVPTS